MFEIEYNKELPTKDCEVVNLKIKKALDNLAKLGYSGKIAFDIKKFNTKDKKHLVYKLNKKMKELPLFYKNFSNIPDYVKYPLNEVLKELPDNSFAKDIINYYETVFKKEQNNNIYQVISSYFNYEYDTDFDFTCLSYAEYENMSFFMAENDLKDLLEIFELVIFYPKLFYIK